MSVLEINFCVFQSRCWTGFHVNRVRWQRQNRRDCDPAWLEALGTRPAWRAFHWLLFPATSRRRDVQNTPSARDLTRAIVTRIDERGRRSDAHISRRRHSEHGCVGASASVGRGQRKRDTVDITPFRERELPHEDARRTTRTRTASPCTLPRDGGRWSTSCATMWRLGRRARRGEAIFGAPCTAFVTRASPGSPMRRLRS